MTDVSLTDAAKVLRLSYQVALNRILRGELKGWQDERRRWRVDSNDLRRAVGGQGRNESASKNQAVTAENGVATKGSARATTV